MGLDEPAGPPGATVRHLLAHASGLGPDGAVLAPPATRRIYSNAGYEVLADVVAGAAGLPFATYLGEAVLGPVGLAGTTLEGSPAAGAVGPVADLLRLGRELLAPTAVASGRSGPVYNPATGQRPAPSTSRRAEEVDARRPAARPLPRLARRSRSRAAPSSSSASASSSTPRREEVARFLTREHGKVPSDALGEVARGLEVVEHCCGIPTLLKGELLRAGLDRDRRLLDPPAARRRRRDHAVQLPGDGAHVDVGARDRLRQHVRAQALREGSLRVGLHGRAAQGGRAPGRRLQRRPRRQGRRRRGARAPGRRRGLASSARRRSRATSTRRARRRASACRRSAARRTT